MRCSKTRAGAQLHRQHGSTPCTAGDVVSAPVKSTEFAVAMNAAKKVREFAQFIPTAPEKAAVQRAAKDLVDALHKYQAAEERRDGQVRA